MDIKVRPGAASDCKVCAQLSVIEELDSPGTDFMPAEFFEAHIDDDEMFLVAEAKGNVVGCVVGQPMKGDWAYISLLIVDPELRGQGVGKMLIETILKRCVAMRFGYVTLFAPKFNKKTLGFYRSRGFVEGKEHIQFGMGPMTE
ncbi:MAG: GNAT family N-acetyltransferase [Candidatus Thorarchaeota archaeon]|jgi:ribosomal protein S18 acetylase RimI-like enzyme